MQIECCRFIAVLFFHNISAWIRPRFEQRIVQTIRLAIAYRRTKLAQQCFELLLMSFLDKDGLQPAYLHSLSLLHMMDS
jgi:hypothetical protein